MARDEDLASIDDLLGAEPETELVTARPVRPGRPMPGRWLVRAALVAALAAGAVDVVLLPLGLRIAYPLLLAGFFALIVLHRSVRAVAGTRLPDLGAVPAAPAIGGVDPAELADGLRLAVSRWENRLAWSERDADRYDAVVRSRLAELADERLRQRHGLTRVTDPRRAREIMGERVWTFLYSPLARPPNRQQLAAVVDDMEKI